MQQVSGILLRSTIKRAQRGLYAGTEKLFGNNVSHSQRKYAQTPILSSPFS